MNAVELLRHLRGHRASVRLLGADLAIRATDGVLTSDVRAAIRAHKVDLIRILADELGSRATARLHPMLTTAPPSKGQINTRVTAATGADPAPPPVSVVRDPIALASVAHRVRSSAKVGVRLQGDRLYEVLGQPRCLLIAFPDLTVTAIDLCTGLDLAPLAQALEYQLVVVHEGVLTLAQLARHGVRLRVVADTHLAVIVRDAGLHNPKGPTDLDVLIGRELGVSLPPTPPTHARDNNSPSHRRAAQAASLFALFERLDRQLHAGGLAQIAQLEFDLAPVIAAMVESGVGVDPVAWQALMDAARAEVAALTEPLRLGLQTYDLNETSISRALRRLGFPNDEEGKIDLTTGTYPAVVDELTRFRRARSFLNDLGAGVENALMRSPDGRVRAELRQVGTANGGFTCPRVNLLAIPRALAVRRAFVPAPGHHLVVADYSHCQLRIAAAYTGEQRLIDTFLAGADPHVMTAALLTDKHVGSVTQEERDRAKAINFGFLYGMGARAFVRYALDTYGVVFSLEQAGGFRSSFFAQYTALAAWHAAVASGTLRSFVSAGGRVRNFEGHNFCAMLAAPIQATQADALKMAMVRLARDLEPLGAHLLLPLHDELIVEAPTYVAGAVESIVARRMREALHELIPAVPVVVTASVRTSWAKDDMVHRNGASP